MAMKGSTGLILMALAVAAFLGSTDGVLPPATFFPALALFAVGAVSFLRASRRAISEAEQRTQEKLRPVIREDRSAQVAAERRAVRRGAALNEQNPPLVEDAPTLPDRRRPPVQAALEVDARAGEFVVEPDVSFPLEVQRGDALADQLRKLHSLLTQGILTEAEYAIAKAKLLG